MRKLLLGIGIVTMLLAVPMTAGAQETLSVKTTYEFAGHNVGPVWLAWTCPTGGVTGFVAEETGIGEATCDPSGTSQDESFDLGGAVFVPSEGSDLERATSVQVSVVDDVWGAGVVTAAVCTDENDNNICGETDEGEASETFCGTSSVLEFKGPGEFNAVASFVGGGVRAVTWGCDVTQAPVVISGGVLDPAGGIYHTFTLA